MARSAVIGALRVHLGLDSAEFSRGVKDASTSLDRLASTAKIALAGVAAAFAAGLGLAAQRVETMEAASRRLDQALANSGNAANTSAKEVAAWADALQRRTGRAAEEVMAVGANLASFKFGEEVFFRAIELADDMSAAWGGDLRNNLEGLSRALDDPIAGFAMLRKRGISLTDQQAELVKRLMESNDKLGAQRVVLQALEEQVKGVAAAGYGGMTKALGNVRLALDSFFDRLVQGGSLSGIVVAGLERVTAAIDAVTANMQTAATAAAIAGTGIAIAFSPALAASIWAVSTALMTGVVGALTAIKAAMLANPFTAIVLGLTAAVTAAYVFRDEIQKAFGVDVIGIVKNAANLVINSFLAAFEDIKLVWENFPDIIGSAVIGAVNAVIRGVNDMVDAVKRGVNSAIGYLNMVPGVEVPLLGFDAPAVKEIANDYADRLAAALTEHKGKIAEIMGRDTLGDLGKLFTGSAEPELRKVAKALQEVGDTATTAGGKSKAAFDEMKRAADRVFEATRTPLERYQAQIKRLNELLAAGAINQDTYNRAVIQAQDALAKASMRADELGRTIQNSLSRTMDSFIEGTGNARDAISSLLKDLAKLAMNNAFKQLFAPTQAGGLGFGNIFAGIGKLFGFAKGGQFQVGGAGGIDSQLVAFRASPNETVTVTRPDQERHGAGGFTYAPQIDARGADAAAVARLERAFARDRADLEAHVRRIVTERPSRRW